MRQRIITIPGNDNCSEHDKFVELIVDMAVSMETVMLPRCYDEVARRVALRAIEMLEDRR